MAKSNERTLKKHYDRRPTELPGYLRGIEFYAIAQTKIGKNENRTTLIEFRPGKFQALIEGFQAAQAAFVAAQVKLGRNVKRLKLKVADLKSELKEQQSATQALESEADDLQEQLAEAIRERDDALKALGRNQKPKGTAADAKEIQRLSRENVRVTGVFDEKRDECMRLDAKNRELQSLSEQQRITLDEREEKYDALAAYVLGLVDTGVIKLNDIPENSGMQTASLRMSGSSTIVRSGKNLRIQGN